MSDHTLPRDRVIPDPPPMPPSTPPSMPPSMPPGAPQPRRVSRDWANPRQLSSSARVMLIDAAGIALMLLLALWSFHSSFGGFGFMVVGFVAMGAAFALGWLAIVRRWPLPVVAVLAITTYVLLASELALRFYEFFGVIPSPRSIVESLTSAATAWKELVTTVPPVGFTGDMMVIPIMLGFFGMLLAFLISQRVRFAPFVLLVPITILVLGIACGTNSPVSVVVNGVLLAAAMIAWMAWRENRRRPVLVGSSAQRRRFGWAALVVVIAATVGAFLGPQMPATAGTREIWRQTVTPPFDPRVYPSPLGGYREYVKLKKGPAGEKVDRVMFTIQGLPAGVPVRLATMDAYDGASWQVSGGDPENPSLYDSGSFERVGAHLTPDAPGQEATVTIVIREYSDVWVPDVGELISIRFRGSAGGKKRDRQLTDSFRYNLNTDTGAAPVRLGPGDRYEMKVRLPYVHTNMTGVQVLDKVPQLPPARSIPEVNDAFATPAILAMPDTGKRLDAIRNEMVAYGAYSDGDTAGVNGSVQRASLPGHSAFRLIAFAGKYPALPLTGNAEQYAATYALLFRSLTVPTRVVMGFVPSDPSLDQPVDVYQSEVEAWVEVPVKDQGWVAIFPTPPREQTVALQSESQQPPPPYKSQTPPPPPVDDPEFDEPAKEQGDAKPLDPANPVTPDQPEPKQQDGPRRPLLASPQARYTAYAAIPFALIGLFGLTVVLIKWLRRVRRRRGGTPQQQIAGGWREVADLSRDLGRPVPGGYTRREAAAVIGEPAIELSRQADARVWSGEALSVGEVAAFWKHVRWARKRIRSGAPFGRRIRSYFAIQSLKWNRERS